MPAVADAPPLAPAAPSSAPPETQTQRYVALDAYRGFIMLLLCSGAFGLRALKDNPFFATPASWFEHVPWEGAVFYDLIQPAFMFMVGMAMPFALAKRKQPLGHVAIRAIRLLLLSQILMCISAGRLHFQLINVLSQMAFTYFLTYAILRLPGKGQVAAAMGLLAAHSALFFLFPGPDGAFSKEGNVGQVIDQWLLGRNYPGLYVTINFVTSTVTTLAGAWAGMLMRGGRRLPEKLRILAAAMAGCFAAGLALALVIPNVKRIWTASFTLYSLGWVLAMLLGFLLLIEVKGWKKWAFPLVVAGMNSIFLYSINQVLQSWLNRAVGVFTGEFKWIGTAAPIFQATTVLAVMWTVCYWLYKRKIFFKV